MKQSIHLQILLNGIKNNGILLFESDEEKIKAIERNQLIMADDKPKILMDISKFTEAVCINSSYNSDFLFPPNIHRAVDYESGDVYRAFAKIIALNEEPIMVDPVSITNQPSVDRVWMKNYAIGDMKWSLQKKSPYTRILESNIDHSDKTVFDYFSKQIKFGEYHTQVKKCAEVLLANGICRGDIIPIIVANTPEIAIIIGALLKIGVTFFPISPMESPYSIENKLSQIHPKLLFMVDFWNSKSGQMISEQLNPVFEKLKLRKIVYSSISHSMTWLDRLGFQIKTCGKGMQKISYDHKYHSFSSYFSNDVKISDYQKNNYYPNDTAVIVSTGGNTNPKLVELSYNNLDAEIRHFLNEKIGIKRGEKISGFLPLDHIYGLMIGLIVPLCKGMTIVFNPKLDRQHIGSYIRKNKINDIALVPELVDDLLISKELKKKDLLRIRQIFSGSSALSPKKIEQISAYFGSPDNKINVIDGYGSSELTAMFLENGVPIIGGSVKIVPSEQDNSSEFPQELGYDQIGELCVHGDTVMKGYFLDPERTAKCLKIHEDGKIWFHTGDLAYIDRTGVVHYQGRMNQDIIKVNGQIVNLFAVAYILGKHDCVEQCTVLATENSKTGSAPIAFIKVKEGYPVTYQLIQDIKKFCSQFLSYYEFPTDILFVDHIPYTAKGKIDQVMLKQMVLSQTEPEQVLTQRLRKGVSN